MDVENLYFDSEDALGKYFCDYIAKCDMCEGTNIDGEPNGYGCLQEEEYVDKNWKSIINESELSLDYEAFIRLNDLDDDMINKIKKRFNKKSEKLLAEAIGEKI